MIKQILTTIIVFFLVGFKTEPADLYGQVKRIVVNTNSKKIQRYRSRESSSSMPSANCECNPGLYSVVYLTSDSLPEVKPEVTNQVMAQKDKMFEPSVIAISVGSTVEFPNFDPFFHNVFSYSKPKKFDLGRYPNGKSKQVQFDEPGTVSVFCEIHYSMRAYIHILATPYYTVSDKDGFFRIPDIRPGQYRVHVWQEKLPELTEEILIKDDSTYLELQ